MYQNTDNFLTSKQCYILILGLVMVLPLLEKELKEIKAVSVILFLSIGIFCALMIVQLEFDGSNLNPDESYSVYYQIKFSLSMMNGIAVMLCSYGFSQNLFPIYQSLEDKSTKNALNATGLGLFLSFLIYVTLAILALYVFGTGLAESVLSNIDAEQTISSYVIRVTFMIMLGCHIPYNFFSGKESLLLMVDEYRRQSMSNALEMSLQQLVITDL